MVNPVSIPGVRVIPLSTSYPGVKCIGEFVIHISQGSTFTFTSGPGVNPVGNVPELGYSIPYIPQVGLCHRNIFPDSDFPTKPKIYFNYMFSDVGL